MLVAWRFIAAKRILMIFPLIFWAKKLVASENSTLRKIKIFKLSFYLMCTVQIPNQMRNLTFHKKKRGGINKLFCALW